MKKLMLVLCIVMVFTCSAYAESYDPQHTMLALNMAVVSINRILTTQDRVILNWEYNNIINRLAIGNIESDAEMKGLYDEIMGFIIGKELRQEDSIRLRESRKQREQEAYYRSMSGGSGNMKAPESSIQKGDKWSLWGWLGSLAVSAVSSIGTGYYDYQATKEQIHREISSGSWQLRKEEIEACSKLQTTLLNATWTLQRKYKLPNEYRLTQENVKEFLSIMEETDPKKRLGRLKFIERKFRVYPPYWFFRADAALSSGDEKEASRSFGRFNEVWRPVLDYDPYRLEWAKYRIRELTGNGTPSGHTAEDIRGLVEVIRDNAPASDWGSNLFAGIVYFALGDSEEAENIIENGNINSGYETEFSGAFLAFMRGDNNFSALPPKVLDLYENILLILPREELIKMAEKGNAVAQNVLGDIYYNGERVEQDYSEMVS